jgi:hypothetical protein
MRGSGADRVLETRGDRDASYLVLEELASFSVYLLLQLRR